MQGGKVTFYRQHSKIDFHNYNTRQYHNIVVLPDIFIYTIGFGAFTEE